MTICCFVPLLNSLLIGAWRYDPVGAALTRVCEKADDMTVSLAGRRLIGRYVGCGCHDSPPGNYSSPATHRSFSSSPAASRDAREQQICKRTVNNAEKATRFREPYFLPMSISKQVRLLQEIKHPFKRAATSSQFQQYACSSDHYFLELA
jgi:hypothetical protein